jgi:hypothetical protein
VALQVVVVEGQDGLLVARANASEPDRRGRAGTMPNDVVNSISCASPGWPPTAKHPSLSVGSPWPQVAFQRLRILLWGFRDRGSGIGRLGGKGRSGTF